MKSYIYALLLTALLTVAAQAAPAVMSPDDEFMDTFQVMCVLRAPLDYDDFNKIATIMQLPLLATHNGADGAGGVYSEKDWILVDGETPFVRAVRIDKRATASQTSCAIEAEIPDGGEFRRYFINYMHLGNAREADEPGQTALHWDGQFSPNTSLALHEQLPLKHPEPVEVELTWSPVSR